MALAQRFDVSTAPPAILLLADGTYFEGTSRGAPGVVQGELSLNTSMTGYQEVLSDPASAGLLVCLSGAHIGNYGVNRHDMQSDRVHARGLIVSTMTHAPSNHRAEESLPDWLQRTGTVAISGVDTRALALHLRDRGATAALIATEKTAADLDELRDLFAAQSAPDTPSQVDLSAPVEPIVAMAKRVEILPADLPAGQEPLGEARVEFLPFFNESTAPNESKATQDRRPHLVVLNLGVKFGLLIALNRLGFRLTLAPASSRFEDLQTLEPDGILLSDGPGNPSDFGSLSPHLEAAARTLPLIGIGLGFSLLAELFGAKRERRQVEAYSANDPSGAPTGRAANAGHGTLLRGAGQPVRVQKTGRVVLTYQNHGYTLKNDPWPDALQVTHTDLNTGGVAGFRHRTLPVLGVQFQPEGSPGAHDARGFLDELVSDIFVDNFALARRDKP